MYCPGCSTQANEGAKFCKACGMNLSVISQAVSGGVVISDPIRDREFKRARKQISDGIHGSAIGAACLIAAALPYFLVNPSQAWSVVLALILALVGVYKVFRSVGTIIDAKVGPKLLDPALQPRSTGSLNGMTTGGGPAVRPSQRLDSPVRGSAYTRPVGGVETESGPNQVIAPP